MKKKDKEAKEKDSGGEASANYMVAEAPGGKGRSIAEEGRGTTTTTTESRIADKLKEEVKYAKDRVISTGDKAAADSTKKSVSSSTTTTMTTTDDQVKRYEEGTATGTTTTFDRTKDSTKGYDEKEPMSPAKIKEHEPTAVQRDSSDQKIVELGQESASTEAAEEEEEEEEDRAATTTTTTTTRERPEKQSMS